MTVQIYNGSADTMFLWFVAAIPYFFQPFDSLWSFLLATKTPRSFLEHMNFAAESCWCRLNLSCKLGQDLSCFCDGGWCVHLFLCFVRKVQHF